MGFGLCCLAKDIENSNPNPKQFYLDGTENNKNDYNANNAGNADIELLFKNYSPILSPTSKLKISQINNIELNDKLFNLNVFENHQNSKNLMEITNISRRLKLVNKAGISSTMLNTSKNNSILDKLQKNTGFSANANITNTNSSNVNNFNNANDKLYEEIDYFPELTNSIVNHSKKNL